MHLSPTHTHTHTRTHTGLLRTYMSDPISNPDFLNGCAKDHAFKRMLFGLAFFHSIVQVSEPLCGQGVYLCLQKTTPSSACD